MDMLRYFKGETADDIGFGSGKFYMAFDGEWVVRQVELYKDRWFRSDNSDDYFEELGPGLCDQPLATLLRENTIKEIPKDEFEDAWFRASQPVTKSA